MLPSWGLADGNCEDDGGGQCAVEEKQGSGERGARPSSWTARLEGVGAHREVDFVFLQDPHVVVEGAEQALLPQEVAVEPPEEDHGDPGDGEEFGPAFPRQEDEQGGDQDDAPPLHPERVGREAVDHALDEFQMLDLAVHSRRFLHGRGACSCDSRARFVRGIMLPKAAKISHRTNLGEDRVRGASKRDEETPPPAVETITGDLPGLA